PNNTAPPARLHVTFAFSSAACTIFGVNNTSRPLDAVVLKFSGKGLNTLVMADERASGVIPRMSDTDGEVRTTVKLEPGQRMLFATLAGKGTLDAITVKSAGRATEHNVEAPLTTGRRLVIFFEESEQVKLVTE